MGCSSRSTTSPSASRTRGRRSSPPPRRSIHRTPRSTRSWKAGIRPSLASFMPYQGADLDNDASYAGMVESTLSTPDARQANRIGARPDGQRRNRRCLIERLREGAQVHTARGRRPQVDETVTPRPGAARADARAVRPPRAAARYAKTANPDLAAPGDAAPDGRSAQQTAQATAAIRKALADQRKIRRSRRC